MLLGVLRMRFATVWCKLGGDGGGGRGEGEGGGGDGGGGMDRGAGGENFSLTMFSTLH